MAVAGQVSFLMPKIYEAKTYLMVTSPKYQVEFATKEGPRISTPIFENISAGVNKILGFGDGAVPISEKIIQTIKERTGKNNRVKLEEDLKEGDIVQVTSGPFKELNGIFLQRMSDHGRVRILLNLIGVELSVQIDRRQIKKAA